MTEQAPERNVEAQKPERQSNLQFEGYLRAQTPKDEKSSESAKSFLPNLHLTSGGSEANSNAKAVNAYDASQLPGRNYPRDFQPTPTFPNNRVLGSPNPRLDTSNTAHREGVSSEDAARNGRIFRMHQAMKDIRNSDQNNKVPLGDKDPNMQKWLNSPPTEGDGKSNNRPANNGDVKADDLYARTNAEQIGNLQSSLAERDDKGMPDADDVLHNGSDKKEVSSLLGYLNNAEVRGAASNDTDLAKNFGRYAAMDKRADEVDGRAPDHKPNALNPGDMQRNPELDKAFQRMQQEDILRRISQNVPKLAEHFQRAIDAAKIREMASQPKQKVPESVLRPKSRLEDIIKRPPQLYPGFER